MFGRPLVPVRRRRDVALAVPLLLNFLAALVVAPSGLAADRGDASETGSRPSTAAKPGRRDEYQADHQGHDKGKLFDGVVNLNTAPPALLLLLPGVGPGRVRGILTYRAHRPFRTVDELVRVKGIGRRMVREIRLHLAVSGPSTARGGPTGASALEALNALAAQPSPPVGPPARPPLCRPTPLQAGRGPATRGHPRPVRSAANHCASPP